MSAKPQRFIKSIFYKKMNFRRFIKAYWILSMFRGLCENTLLSFPSDFRQPCTFPCDAPPHAVLQRSLVLCLQPYNTFMSTCYNSLPFSLSSCPTSLNKGVVISRPSMDPDTLCRTDIDQSSARHRAPVKGADVMGLPASHKRSIQLHTVRPRAQSHSLQQ